MDASYILRRRRNMSKEDKKTKKERGPTPDKKKPVELSDKDLAAVAGGSRLRHLLTTGAEATAKKLSGRP